jgi:hypothetical protein
MVNGCGVELVGGNAYMVCTDGKHRRTIRACAIVSSADKDEHNGVAIWVFLSCRKSAGRSAEKFQID